MVHKRLPRRAVAKSDTGLQLQHEQFVVAKPRIAAQQVGEHSCQSLQESKMFRAEVKSTVSIAKVDKERRLIYGVVLEPDEVDAHNDTIDKEVIESSAHEFLAKFNRETELGVMHKMFGNIGVELAESYISPGDMTMGAKPVKQGSWVMVVKVVDDAIWKKVKAGEITGFSIGGLATVV